jgi:hypothetical protein
VASRKTIFEVSNLIGRVGDTVSSTRLVFRRAESLTLFGLSKDYRLTHAATRLTRQSVSFMTIGNHRGLVGDSLFPLNWRSCCRFIIASISLRHSILLVAWACCSFINIHKRTIENPKLLSISIIAVTLSVSIISSSPIVYFIGSKFLSRLFWLPLLPLAPRRFGTLDKIQTLLVLTIALYLLNVMRMWFLPIHLRFLYLP